MSNRDLIASESEYASIDPDTHARCKKDATSSTCIILLLLNSFC